MKKIILMMMGVGFSTLLIASNILVKADGKPLKVKGNFPAVGEKAPTARVVKTDMS